MRLTLQLLLILALATTAGQAGVLLTFDQPNQIAQPGDLLHFNATIFNNGDDEVILGGFTNTALSADFTVTDLFFDNTPPSLPGHSDSGDIDLFDVQVGAPPYGLYTGTYKIFDENNALLVQADYSVQVVPEPGTIAMFVAAGLALWLRHRLT